MSRSASWLGLAGVFLLPSCASTGADSSGLERRVRSLEDQVYRLEREREELAQRVARLEQGEAVATLGARSAPRPHPSATRTPEPAREPVRALPGVADATPPPVRTPASGTGPVGGGSAESDFDRARELYRRARFADAAAGFVEFLARWPRHARAEESRFLLGESFYGAGNFPQAVVEYGLVVDTWPQGARAPESLHKIGLSYYELGYDQNALEHLERLQRSYPRSEAAAAAQPLIEKLRRRQKKR